MKYALLIYTPTQADEYSAITTAPHSQAPGQRDGAATGPWVEAAMDA